jgi:hypothetical protein
MDDFPSIVRRQSTTYLCAGEDDSVARERNTRRMRERGARASCCGPEFSIRIFLRLEPREFRIEIESYRFYMVDFYFSLFLRIF